jgi:hypothetical protein
LSLEFFIDIILGPGVGSEMSTRNISWG